MKRGGGGWRREGLQEKEKGEGRRNEGGPGGEEMTEQRTGGEEGRKKGEEMRGNKGREGEGKKRRGDKDRREESRLKKSFPLTFDLKDEHLL